MKKQLFEIIEKYLAETQILQNKKAYHTRRSSNENKLKKALKECLLDEILRPNNKEADRIRRINNENKLLEALVECILDRMLALIMRYTDKIFLFILCASAIVLLLAMAHADNRLRELPHKYAPLILQKFKEIWRNKKR